MYYADEDNGYSEHDTLAFFFLDNGRIAMFVLFLI